MAEMKPSWKSRCGKAHDKNNLEEMWVGRISTKPEWQRNVILLMNRKSRYQIWKRIIGNVYHFCPLGSNKLQFMDDPTQNYNDTVNNYIPADTAAIYWYHRRINSWNDAKERGVVLQNWKTLKIWLLIHKPIHREITQV